MTPSHFLHMESPVGALLLLGNGEALSGVYMSEDKHMRSGTTGLKNDPRAFRTAREELGAYFAGELRVFAAPLVFAGTAFQQLVWRALCDIPFGKTESYGELARRIGHPAASRAVGMANSRNPISIIVPCHRVIGADGTLTGYAGGIDNKRWLLAHEAKLAGARSNDSVATVQAALQLQG